MLRLIVVLQVLLVWVASSFAQDAATESRRHLVRGVAAIEMAKSDADLALAEEEFRRATVIAPDFAAAWLHLGKVQATLGEYAGAIDSFKRYLALAPTTAPDAAAIGDEIIKLEFRQEQAEKVKSRGGTWVAEDGTSYRLVLDGNRITLSTADHHISDAEAVSSYPIAGKVPISTPVALQYSLALQGNRVTGSWRRAAVKADACTIPEDNGEVAGEFQDADHMLKLQYIRTKYHAYTLIGILTDDFCREVVAVEKQEVEKRFFGPLPQGGLGVALYGIHSYWPGGFSMVQFGWSGHLGVGGIDETSPAFAAGLRKGDEILAIDNAAVKNLSASEAILRLRGAPGTEVVLSVLRKKPDEAVTVRLRRVVITDKQFGMH
jgi:hypothetical protein